MLSRLFTWAFYALVFFLLGVWVGGFSPGVRALTREGGAVATAAFEQVQHWAIATITERPAPRPTAAEPTPADLMRLAREAFERGETSDSVALYRQRLIDDPNDIDARGELGNVLTSAGRLSEADDAYYETALHMGHAGQSAQASALEAAIRRHNAALADKLVAELKIAKSGN